MKPLKSRWGAVKPYTRHERRCRYRRKPDHNDCPCAKWRYVNPRNGRPSRRSLNTPSWAEAMEIATATLRSLDPEIKAARAQTARQAVAIEEAVVMSAPTWSPVTATMAPSRTHALLGTVDPVIDNSAAERRKQEDNKVQIARSSEEDFTWSRKRRPTAPVLP